MKRSRLADAASRLLLDLGWVLTRSYFWFRRLQRPIPANPDPNNSRLVGSGTMIAPLGAVACQFATPFTGVLRNPTI